MVEFRKDCLDLGMRGTIPERHFLEINISISHPATGRCSTGFQEIPGSRGYAWFRLDVKSEYLFTRNAAEWNPLDSHPCLHPALTMQTQPKQLKAARKE